MAEENRWWGEFPFENECGKIWQIGALSLSVRRGTLEWRMAHRQDPDFLKDGLKIAESAGAETAEEQDLINRYAFRKSPEILRILPALADRPFVVKPETPLFLSPGEETVLYVSTPVWVQLSVGRPWTQLLEIPSYRPTDTWFGATTITGQLCYASRTAACLKLDDLPVRPHRAVSSVTIKNKAGSALPLEKLKLPALNLSLYTSPNGRLWTDALILEREHDGEQANVRLKEEGLPGGLTLVSKPRQKMEKRFLLDAFAGLLSRKAEKKDDAIPRKSGPVPDSDT